MTERERVYGEALRQQVVTSDELFQIIHQNKPHLSRKTIHDVYISPLVKQGKLKRVRRGLFLGLPLGFSEGSPLDFNKLLLAAKIRGKQGVLAYHTALEFYGCAYNDFNEVLLGVRTYFPPFHLGNVEFRPVFLPNPNLGVVELVVANGFEVNVTSRERTLLDCLNRPSHAGGWEECLKSLESLNGLSFKDLIRLVESFNPNQLLLRRLGFVLELLKNHSIYYQSLPEWVLSSLHDLLSSSRLYLDKDTRSRDRIFVRTWKLYVPHHFVDDNLRGI